MTACLRDSARRVPRRFRISDPITVPLCLAGRSAFHCVHPPLIIACWPTAASRSTPSRSRLVDSLPSWRTGLVSLICEQEFLASSVETALPCRAGDARGPAYGFWVGACAHPAAALAFHRRAASIMPARREQSRRRSRSFLRIAPTGPPGGGLSVSFVAAVWPPLPRERPTHQL